MPFPDSDVDTKDMHIIFATSEGKIRKNNLEDFTSINASGKIAMKLDGNDKIIGVKICRDDQDIILSTKLGKCIRFESKKLRVFKGRSSKGIRGINLAENDTIVSLSIIDHDSNKKAKNKDQKSEIKAKEKFILSITENGYGKRTSHYDYRVTNRGGKGIIGIVNSQRNGNVSSSFPVFEGDQILISTNKGRVIRTAVKEIRIAGRNTQGVRIIKLTGDEKVVSAIKLDDNLHLMKNIAIYPGTFDPITFGHIDVIKKSLKIVDKVIVGISDGNQKNFLFSLDERIEIVKRALYKDLKFKKNKVDVIKFNTLTTDLCKKYKSNIILRGLRAVSDFEYEFQLAGMNRKLNNQVETIFLMSDVENQIISSRFVKEIAQHNGDLKKFTTKSTIKSLKEVYE